jgi:predicted dehydrogenase
MSQPHCRWGILGAANIARKNWKAIRNAGNSALVAVASRDHKRAQHFIDGCQAAAPLNVAPVALGTYQQLVDSRDIDAVYIPLPTGLRRDWAIKAAQAGKHVLCEKPCGATTADVVAMLDACHQARVQFMDGVMFMHSQRLALLRQTLDDQQSIGAVRRITSQFSFKGGDDFLATNIRANAALEPLGCLGDLGWYNIRISLWAMKEQLPERVTGCILNEHQGVPMEFAAQLFYPGGVSASFYCSFLTANHQWVKVSGTAGEAHVPDFVVPFYGCEAAFEVNNPIFRIQGCDFNMEGHRRRLAVHEYSSGATNSQETNMIRAFSRIVVSGQLEPHWGQQAFKTQQVVDACLQSARNGSKAVKVLR